MAGMTGRKLKTHAKERTINTSTGVTSPLDYTTGADRSFYFVFALTACLYSNTKMEQTRHIDMRKPGSRFCTMPIIIKVKSLFYFLLKSNLSNDKLINSVSDNAVIFSHFLSAVFIFYQFC